MWWQTWISEFVTLFLVINPFGALPTFLDIAATLDPRAKRKLALNAVLISFVVLVFFVFAGAILLENMGISIRAFAISGGILLFVVALDMVRGQSHSSAQGTRQHGAGGLSASHPEDRRALTVVLLTDDDRFNLPGQLMTVGRLALVLVIALLLLLAAGPITRLIGTAGVSIISRVMGMLLAALAVTLVLSAVSDWLSLPKL